jgi:hypothetical protein
LTGYARAVAFAAQPRRPRTPLVDTGRSRSPRRSSGVKARVGDADASATAAANVEASAVPGEVSDEPPFETRKNRLPMPPVLPPLSVAVQTIVWRPFDSAVVSMMRNPTGPLHVGHGSPGVLCDGVFA